MATYDAGIVTAYGAAVRGGYTGTYEEFCAQQANYAASAAAVEQAKEDVQELVDSIPADYTQLSDDVSSLKEDIAHIGLSEDIKAAMLQIASKVVYIDEHGQDYYDALYDALYPPAELVSISAVYTQSGTVYDNQTLDSLKTDLVVTAHMSDGTSQTVTTYTLSGTLATGTSTITVAYGGKTATFTVTVTHAETQYSITNTLTNCTNSNSAVAINENDPYSGTLSANAGYVMSTVTVVIGNTDITSTAYDSGTGVISISSVTGNIVITASAVEDVGWISGQPYSSEDVGWVTGYYINNSGEPEVSTNPNDCITDFLPCHGASEVQCSSKPYTGSYYLYDAEKNFLRRQGIVTYATIGDTYPIDKNAYYVRFSGRNNTSLVITPYLYPTLTDSTPYTLSQKYVLDYGSSTPSEWATSDYALCYGATSVQVSTTSRSWVTFFDAEKTKIGEVIRQNTTAETAIPEGTYYIKVNPNTSNVGNSNNPIVVFTA